MPAVVFSLAGQGCAGRDYIVVTRRWCCCCYHRRRSLRLPQPLDSRSRSSNSSSGRSAVDSSTDRRKRLASWLTGRLRRGGYVRWPVRIVPLKVSSPSSSANSASSSPSEPRRAEFEVPERLEVRRRAVSSTGDTRWLWRLIWYCSRRGVFYREMQRNAVRTNKLIRGSRACFRSPRACGGFLRTLTELDQNKTHIRSTVPHCTAAEMRFPHKQQQCLE